MFLLRPIVLSLLLLFPLVVGSPAQRIAELQRRFDQQKDPVQRAKFFSKHLGPAEISEIAKLYSSGPLEAANARARSYVDQVALLSDDLSKAVRDPERHSGGFIQLEVHIRDALLRLRDVSTSLPFGDRDELKKQMDRLDRIHSDIFAKLFPRIPKKGGAPR